MPFCKLEDLIVFHKGKQPFFGLDLGEKTIGIALSDFEHRLANPLQTLARTKFQKDTDILLELIEKHQIAALVVGWPLLLDGAEHRATQSVKDFCQNFLKKRDLPIVLWDERLSTKAVTRHMIDADVSRAKRREKVDQLAASYFLQGALDRFQQLVAEQSKNK